MTYRDYRRILLLGAALSLVACGGGGGQVASTPTPTPTPTPSPTPAAVAIIESATTSQEFAVKGATGSSVAGADQLRIRYDAATKAYEVQLPSSAAWERLTPLARIPSNPPPLPQTECSARDREWL